MLRLVSHICLALTFSVTGCDPEGKRSRGASKPSNDLEDAPGYLGSKIDLEDESSAVIQSNRGGVVSIGDAELEIYADSIDQDIDELEVSLGRSVKQTDKSGFVDAAGATVGSPSADVISVDVVEKQSQQHIAENLVDEPFEFRQVMYKPRDTSKLWLELTAYAGTEDEEVLLLDASHLTIRDYVPEDLGLLQNADQLADELIQVSFRMLPLIAT